MNFGRFLAEAISLCLHSRNLGHLAAASNKIPAKRKSLILNNKTRVYEASAGCDKLSPRNRPILIIRLRNTVSAIFMNLDVNDVNL